MKKLLSFCIALMTFVLPSLAQSHDFSVYDREPAVLAKITKDQVPAVILNAVSIQFDKNNPLTWSKFPYALKEYGWVYDVGAENLNLDRYEVTMKTSKGDDLWAVYTNKGELVETREMSANITIPSSVMDEFLKCQYKDWKIIGNKEIIRFYHDHDLNKNNVEQHFRITVEKNGVKRSISFNWQGTN
ncbi:MAG TPA: hypothetical protein VIK14_11540 [Ignavibacteria bacterium]